MTRILFVGNNLTQKTKYQTTFTTLSNLLEKEGYKMIRTSSKRNKILRLLDMIGYFLLNIRKSNFILIDTYSTSNFYYALILSQLARLFHKKYIPILHGGNLPNRLDKNPIMSKLIFKHSYQNVAPSGYLQYEFEKRGYQTVFIPNVLNIVEYKYKERKLIAPKLLWVRAFAHLYNPKMAVYVLNELKKNYKNAQLCMVGPDKGDGSFQEVQQLVKELNLENRVLFTGVLPKEEWHKLSEDYDVFINTTTIDNTPVSVMEAMALGLPIVSTNVGGISYLIDDEKEGMLVDSNDIFAMTQKIDQLISQNELVKGLALNARKKAESFDWEQVKIKWLELFK